MEQYHFVKTVLNYEDAYLPDGPLFVNMDGKHVKTDDMHKGVVAKRMAAFMGLPMLTLTQNRHAEASWQRAAKATGDTGLGNSHSTVELYYDGPQEAQGIVSKNLANARVMEIFAGWRQEMPEVKLHPRRRSNFA
jgi:hypothetical protein